MRSEQNAISLCRWHFQVQFLDRKKFFFFFSFLFKFHQGWTSLLIHMCHLFFSHYKWRLFALQSAKFILLGYNDWQKTLLKRYAFNLLVPGRFEWKLRFSLVSFDEKNKQICWFWSYRPERNITLAEGMDLCQVDKWVEKKWIKNNNDRKWKIIRK